jgi:hypothetical protein
LIFSHAFNGPDLYGASSFFETMPSRPSFTNGVEHFHAIAPGVFVLNAALNARQVFRYLRCLTYLDH